MAAIQGIQQQSSRKSQGAILQRSRGMHHFDIL